MGVSGRNGNIPVVIGCFSARRRNRTGFGGFPSRAATATHMKHRLLNSPGLAGFQKTCRQHSRAAGISKGKARFGPSSSSVDLFDDPALLRFNHIGPVVVLDIAVFPKDRRIPIIIIREGLDLHGIRQTVANPNSG